LIKYFGILAFFAAPCRESLYQILLVMIKAIVVALI